MKKTALLAVAAATFALVACTAAPERPIEYKLDVDHSQSAEDSFEQYGWVSPDISQVEWFDPKKGVEHETARLVMADTARALPHGWCYATMYELLAFDREHHDEAHGRFNILAGAPSTAFRTREGYLAIPSLNYSGGLGWRNASHRDSNNSEERLLVVRPADGTPCQ